MVYKSPYITWGSAANPRRSLQEAREGKRVCWHGSIIAPGVGDDRAGSSTYPRPCSRRHDTAADHSLLVSSLRLWLCYGPHDATAGEGQESAAGQSQIASSCSRCSRRSDTEAPRRKHPVVARDRPWQASASSSRWRHWYDTSAEGEPLQTGGWSGLQDDASCADWVLIQFWPEGREIDGNM